MRGDLLHPPTEHGAGITSLLYTCTFEQPVRVPGDLLHPPTDQEAGITSLLYTCTFEQPVRVPGDLLHPPTEHGAGSHQVTEQLYTCTACSCTWWPPTSFY